MVSANFTNMLQIAASGMTAESTRMNTLSSNLANAGSVGSSEESTYHAKRPVFTTIMEQMSQLGDSNYPEGGVRVTDIVKSQKPLDWHFDPDNPLADEEGKVYITDVNPIEEMADMIDASRHYQALSEVIKTGKSLAIQTIREINS